MADNQVEIEVIAKTDTSEVEDLEDLVEEIKSTAEDEVSLNVDASDATSSLEEAESQAGELESELENLDGQTVNLNVDSSQLDDANEKIQETEDSLANVKTALVGLVATAEIEHMATVADNINTSWNRLTLTFEGTGVSMDSLKDKVSEVNAETSRGAGVIREYFNQMGIAGVTNVNLLAESFESLSGKAYQTGNSIESMESKMQTMVLTGNASEKMLKSLGLSAEDLANAIGVSVDELSDAFDQLSPEQRLQAITNAMGDGAAANQMYGDSYEAMKQKAENAMSGLEGAVGQAILPTVIPVLDTATQAVKGLTDGFKNLPEPVQGAIGTVMGVSAIATTGIGMFGEFAGAIANLGDAYKVLKTVYEALIPTEIAEGAAGWFSIGWIAAAILLGIALGLAFIYLYENCDWFREAVDSLAATLQWLGQVIYSSVVGAIEWLSQSFQDFTSQIGLNTNDWTQSVLGFILFIQTLPLRLAQILIDTLAQALGFGENFSQNMIQGAANAVSGFLEWISQLPLAVEENLMAVVESTITWLTTLWQSITEITFLIAEALAFPFVNIAMVVYESLMTIWSVITGILASVWASISAFGMQLLTTVMTVVNGVITNLMRGIAYFATIPGTIAGYLSQVISRVVSWGASLASNFLSAATKSVTNFANQISQIPSKLGTELSNALNKVNEWAATLPAKFWEAGVNAVKNFLSALGIASPGTMQRMLVWEVTEMGKRVPEESKQLLTNVSRLGENIVDEFGEPTLGVNFDDTANASFTALSETSSNRLPTINLNLEIGSVDNEDRVQEIVEVIRRELNWNNLTAGRDV